MRKGKHDIGTRGIPDIWKCGGNQFPGKSLMAEPPALNMRYLGVIVAMELRYRAFMKGVAERRV